MRLSKDVCPVPFDQQPLNEFYALQESGIFSWFGLNNESYIYSLFMTSCILAFLLTPIIFAAFSRSLIVFCAFNSLCVMLILLLILMRLYLGWSYIVDRLFSATIFYEESGWYDGQIWIKTPEMLTKDRLIGTYYILPALHRIRLTFLFLFLAIALDFFSINCFVNIYKITS